MNYREREEEPSYTKAKAIVEEYERLQRDKLKRFAKGDFDLLTKLSARPSNILIAHNEQCKDGDELIYISDIVNLIIEDSSTYKGTGMHKGEVFYLVLMRFRKMGIVSYYEIMKYVEPHLKQLK